MTFEELKSITQGREFPVSAVNENNEFVIIEYGKQDGVEFFTVTTAQNNNWCRVNTFWADGTTEETYKK